MEVIFLMDSDRIEALADGVDGGIIGMSGEGEGDCDVELTAPLRFLPRVFSKFY